MQLQTLTSRCFSLRADLLNFACCNFLQRALSFDRQSTAMETVSMDRWKDKVAVVTGVSSGIGYAVARRLANNGMIVAGCARRMEEMQELQQECPEGKFHQFQADLRNESEIKAFFQFIDDKLGRVDVLINNAGVTRMSSMLDSSSEGLKTMFSLNVLAPCFCTREALAIMEKHDIKDGYIIFTNSIHGHKVEQQKKDKNGKLKSIYPYEATKHALKVLSEGLRQELRAKGSKIRVGNVSPGAVETEIEDSMPARDKDKAYKKETLDLEMEDRGEAFMMAPDDMADAFIFMLQTGSGGRYKKEQRSLSTMENAVGVAGARNSGECGGGVHRPPVHAKVDNNNYVANSQQQPQGMFKMDPQQPISSLLTAAEAALAASQSTNSMRKQFIVVYYQFKMQPQQLLANSPPPAERTIIMLPNVGPIDDLAQLKQSCSSRVVQLIHILEEEGTSMGQGWARYELPTDGVTVVDRLSMLGFQIEAQSSSNQQIMWTLTTTE